jgi:hypothetical protein
MTEKYRIIESEPKVRLSYTVPIVPPGQGPANAVQFSGCIDGVLLLGTKERYGEWSLDQVSFTDYPNSTAEYYRHIVELVVSADTMNRATVSKGNHLNVPADYPLNCRWESQLARGTRKVELRAYVINEYYLQFPILLKSAFDTISQVRKIISEVSVVVPRLTPESLRCLKLLSHSSRSTLSWSGHPSVRALKQFLFLFDAFQQEFELLMTISPDQVIQMEGFIQEWFDYFKLVKKGSSRTSGCVSIEHEKSNVIKISVAGCTPARISTTLKSPLPTDSVYINEVFRFLLMAITCLKFSEKDSAFLSRVTREVFGR